MRKDNSTSTCLFSVKVYGKSVPCDRVQLVIGTVGDVSTGLQQARKIHSKMKDTEPNADKYKTMYVLLCICSRFYVHAQILLVMIGIKKIPDISLYMKLEIKDNVFINKSKFCLFKVLMN